jgi:hypothetical protein
MASKRKEKPFGTDLAYIRWFDSAIYPEGCFPAEDLTGYKENESCGILVQETDDSVSVALDRCLDTKNLRQVLCVPKANIRVFRRMKV